MPQGMTEWLFTTPVVLGWNVHLQHLGIPLGQGLNQLGQLLDGNQKSGKQNQLRFGSWHPIIYHGF